MTQTHTHTHSVLYIYIDVFLQNNSYIKTQIIIIIIIFSVVVIVWKLRCNAVTRDITYAFKTFKIIYENFAWKLN